MLSRQRPNHSFSNKSAVFKRTSFRNQSAGGCKRWLLYSSWQWFGNPKMLLCNRRVCTWPSKPLTLLLSHTQAAWRRPPAAPQKNQLLLFLSHHRAGFIYTTGLNDFLNKSFERTCLCFHSSLRGYITVTQISRGRFSCTFLTWQLSDCLRIIWCGAHVGQTGRGLLNQIHRERKRESLWICPESSSQCSCEGLSGRSKVTLRRPQERGNFSAVLGHWANQTVYNLAVLVDS